MEGVGIGFVLVMLLIVFGVPIAMAFGLMTLFLIGWFGVDPSYLIPTNFIKFRSVVLLSVPLFIFFGHLLDTSGLAKRLIEFINSVIGHVRGGLASVTVVTTALFSAISGTDSAAIACIGTVMIPRLVEHRYPRGLATALIACSGILGQLVPPSVPMIFYAIITGNSIPAVWLATVGPAIVIVCTYILLSRFAVRKLSIKLSAKPETLKLHAIQVGQSTFRALPVLVLPVIVLGGIYGGIVTPTEGACLGVVYVLVVGMVYRSLSFKEIQKSMLSAAVISGVVMLMIFFTEVSSKILVVEGVTEDLSNWIVGISPNVYFILFLLNIVLLIMGMMMNDLSGTVLAAALLYPIAIEAGIHPLHFAAIVGVNLGLGTVTPPTAPMLFLAGRIGDCSAEEYMRPAMFLMWAGMLPVLFLTTYWPALSLTIPRWFGFIR